jgi:hypothetical protein
LKHGWMKFWLFVSLALIVSGSCNAGAHAVPRMFSNRVGQAKAHPANETLLAGLRPGRDTLAMAKKRFKSKEISEDHESGYQEWRDDCSGRAIRLELNAQSVIQSVTITTLAAKQGECSQRRPDFLDAKNWVTGLGLRLGDSQDQIVSFYGEPNSSGPAAKNGQELELMYYQFDWAGSDVPQVMEILCARDTGRVVEITLAFPSL